MVLDKNNANIFGLEVETLPISAQLSFAVRCVRRTQPLFSGSATHAPRIIQDRVVIPLEHIDVMNRSLDAVQNLAARIHGGKARKEELAPDDIDAVYRSSYSIIIRNQKGAAYSDYAFAVFSVNKACQEALRGNDDKAVYYIRNALMSSLNSAANFYGGEGQFREVANRAFQFAKSLGMKDLLLLKEAAEEGEWSKSALIPPDFFSVHSVFDTDVLIGRRKITDIALLIEERLAEAMRRNPDITRDFHSRNLVDSIAELFRGFGFDVELDRKTRDGAECILAVKNELAMVRYLMECKRRALENTVEIAVASRLHGTVSENGASDVVIASISRSSGEDGDVSKRTSWLLERGELNGLVEWLDRYQKRKLKGILYFNGKH